METVVFRAGHTILHEGEEGHTAFFIVNGGVEVIVGDGPRAKVVGALGAGEVFGEMCLIEPGPRSATVKAVAATECVSVSFSEFLSLIETEPERAVDFMKTLVRRLRQMNEIMAAMGPRRRGLRELFGDMQKSVAPAQLDPEVVAISWSMLW
jgi:CRP-like cAMP-binding protein